MQIHQPTPTTVKCLTCQIQFPTIEQHKNHYRQDFHRYNVKRKLVKLSSVTLQQFNAKKINSPIVQQQLFNCGQCGKKFNSVNTLNQHIISKKHSSTNSQPKNVIPKSIIPKNKPSPFTSNKTLCLFCQTPSQTFQQNLQHMQSIHTFFIPQLKYCINKQGLIQYLQQKIQIGCMCITCQNKHTKDFQSGSSVRKHMNDKGHTFMKTDQGYNQYIKYYDFSSQFKEIIFYQQNKNIPGIEFTDITVVQKDGEDMDDEDNWEDQSQNQQEANQQDEEQWQQEQSDNQDTKQQKQKQQANEKKKKVKTYHIMRPTHTKNGQLLLPNGKILGHRKYRYLYKQTYRSSFWLNHSMKALGCQSSTTEIISKEKLKQLIKYDKLSKKYKNKWQKKLLHKEIHNNMLQKYFRTRNSL